jgi:hypothetical protein
MRDELFIGEPQPTQLPGAEGKGVLIRALGKVECEWI